MCADSTAQITFNNKKNVFRFLLDKFNFKISNYFEENNKFIATILRAIYIWEKAFSALNNIKKSNKIRLTNVEADLYIAVSNVQPKNRGIMQKTLVLNITLIL